MKKISLIICGLAVMAGLASCSDDQYTVLYDDPNKTSDVGCDKLMTGVFIQESTGRNYAYNSYWRMYTWDNIFAKYAQTAGYNNESGSVYYAADSYADDRWENFYIMLAQFRALEDKYNKETPEQQANDKLYKDLAEVFVLDNLTQMADIFGDMPYFKASTLGQTSQLAGSMAPFDDDVEIYRHALTRLGELYKELSTAKLTELQKKVLASQDFINKGDFQKWIAYANSLRLRIAVHVAAQGALTSEARAAVKECMARPLIVEDNNNVELYADLDGFNYWENFRDAFKDINNVASQPMIDAMQKVAGENDPRLQVMYEKNAAGKYVGKSRTEEANFQANHSSDWNEGGKLKWAERYYSYLDSCTYTGNDYFISPVLTAAEVNFLKAEAIQNGWAAGDAKAEFIKGMVASTSFYYRQNNHEYDGASHPSTKMSPTGTVAAYPGDDAVKAYAEKLWTAYGDKLEAIMTQKWVHFGVIQPTQAWTDVRRTGFPKLTYPADSQQQNADFRNLPNRVMWPNTEKASNTANYEAAEKAQANKPSTKLFWAK
ncbi:SusD/RagB family nutrient-binding outer membrane lipoprotein [Prevotella sp.]|uniref:SusD/RagB family nutrient-binding outer membrane lipoprotein n=1 Tax=Prevotella sp. TaxID=59823 RepID=UPI002F9230E2